MSSWSIFSAYSWAFTCIEATADDTFVAIQVTVSDALQAQ